MHREAPNSAKRGELMFYNHDVDKILMRILTIRNSNKIIYFELPIKKEVIMSDIVADIKVFLTEEVEHFYD